MLPQFYCCRCCCNSCAAAAAGTLHLIPLLVLVVLVLVLQLLLLQVCPARCTATAPTAVLAPAANISNPGVSLPPLLLLSPLLVLTVTAFWGAARLTRLTPMRLEALIMV